MTTLFPTMFHGARATIKRATCCFSSAVNTVFWVFGWRGKLASMNIFVTRNANGHSVVGVEHKFGIIYNRLYVMGVNVSARFTAYLARIIVTLINFVSPFCKVAFRLCPIAMKGNSTFPYRGCISSSPLNDTFIRAKFSTVVNGVKLLSACFTDFVKWLSAIRPTRPGAVFGGISTICLNFIRRSTYYANLISLGVFHDTNYTTQYKLSPAYCAVAIQRWVDVTGGEPMLISEE